MKRHELYNGWWNYRFCKRSTGFIGKEEIYYGLIEVFYSKDGSIFAWDEQPVTVYTESKSDLNTFIRQVKDACKRTVVELRNGTLVETNEHIKNNDKIKFWR